MPERARTITDLHPPKSAAERSRDRYWREKLGLKLYHLELPGEDLRKALLQSGWMTQAAERNPGKSAEERALQRLLRAFIAKNLTREVNILPNVGKSDNDRTEP